MNYRCFPTGVCCLFALNGDVQGDQTGNMCGAGIRKRTGYRLILCLSRLPGHGCSPFERIQRFVPALAISTCGKSGRNCRESGQPHTHPVIWPNNRYRLVWRAPVVYIRPGDTRGASNRCDVLSRRHETCDMTSMHLLGLCQMTIFVNKIHTWHAILSNHWN